MYACDVSATFVFIEAACSLFLLCKLCSLFLFKLSAFADSLGSLQYARLTVFVFGAVGALLLDLKNFFGEVLAL